MLNKDDKERKEKQGVEFVKLSELSETESAEISVGDLWILRPKEGIPSVKMTLCGCRAICVA